MQRTAPQKETPQLLSKDKSNDTKTGIKARVTALDSCVATIGQTRTLQASSDLYFLPEIRIAKKQRPIRNREDRTGRMENRDIRVDQKTERSYMHNRHRRGSRVRYAGYYSTTIAKCIPLTFDRRWVVWDGRNFGFCKRISQGSTRK
jgi:hypothetical protein